MDPRTGRNSTCDVTGSTVIDSLTCQSSISADALTAEFVARSGFESVVFFDTSLANTKQALDQLGIEATVGVFARLGEFLAHDSARAVLIGSEIANCCCTITAVCGSSIDLSRLREVGLPLAPQKSLDCVAAVLAALDADNLIERTGAMKLELAAALNNLRYHSLVESLEIAPGLMAHMQLVESVSANEFVAECATRGVSIQASEHNSVVISPPLTVTRSDLFSLGIALDAALMAIGSVSSAPRAESTQAPSRLSPYERDLLANVPPHHGE
jgi:hypothetical protein